MSAQNASSRFAKACGCRVCDPRRTASEAFSTLRNAPPPRRQEADSLEVSTVEWTRDRAHGIGSYEPMSCSSTRTCEGRK
jgi:hypothetical protein